MKPLMPFYEDVAVGDVTELGEHLFAQGEMVAFAREFDPQPFHLDEEAAARTHFGRLPASGWQTAAQWMRLYVDHLNEARQRAREAGEPAPRTGISPGFKNLKWPRPTFVGDRLAYRSTVTAKRPSASRPDFGIVTAHQTGTNQDGVLVFEFESTVFLERRAAEE